MLIYPPSKKLAKIENWHRHSSGLLADGQFNGRREKTRFSYGKQHVWRMVGEHGGYAFFFPTPLYRRPAARYAKNTRKGARKKRKLILGRVKLPAV